MWETIVGDAAAESPLWESCVLPNHERQLVAVFSPLAPAEHALGLETIYEGYLVHYGRSRLFAPPDADTALLLGDYLYAHGLVRIAESGDVPAVADLAELISLCAQSRAEGRDGDGSAWAATASRLGAGGLEAARERLRLRGDAWRLELAARTAAGDEAVDTALAAHARLVG
ncbi:MAG TPA: hypothetical protein VK926_04575 [Gaiellaceae bacterium]|nr:hypothetical protein [Gaiellaceae bacterium]